MKPLSIFRTALMLLAAIRRISIDILNNEERRRRIRIGEHTEIHPTVRFNGKTENITIGIKSLIAEHATLTCRGPYIKIGDEVKINSYCIIETGGGGQIEIGSNTAINSFCTIYGQGGLSIGRNVRIGPRVGIFPSNKHFEDTSQPIAKQGIERLGITIEDDVWLGANVQVMDGISIGRGSVIGAGSVVTKSIPPFALAFGTPARVVRLRGPASPEAG